MQLQPYFEFHPRLYNELAILSKAMQIMISFLLSKKSTEVTIQYLINYGLKYMELSPIAR